MTYDGKSWRYETARQFLEALEYERLLAERLKPEAATTEERELQRIAGTVFTDAQQNTRRMAENVDMVFGEDFSQHINLLLSALGEDIDLEQAIKEWEENYGQRYGD